MFDDDRRFERNTNRASFTCRATENKLRTTHVTFRSCRHGKHGKRQTRQTRPTIGRKIQKTSMHAQQESLLMLEALVHRLIQ